MGLYLNDLINDGGATPTTPIVTPTPAVPTTPIFAATTPSNVSSNSKCFKYSVTNVSNQRYDIGYTDCCTGKDVNFSLEAGQTKDDIVYNSHDYHTNDLVISNLVDYPCTQTAPASTPAPAPPSTPPTSTPSVPKPFPIQDVLIGGAIVLGGIYIFRKFL